MVEAASAKLQRRRADRRSASPTTDRIRQERDDPSSAIPGVSDKKSESRMNRIARRAHEIYEARGGEHGKALEDWLEAQRQVDAELAREGGGDGQ
jgi:Protein of unknown function (DUF2934)